MRSISGKTHGLVLCAKRLPQKYSSSIENEFVDAMFKFGCKYRFHRNVYRLQGCLSISGPEGRNNRIGFTMREQYRRSILDLDF